MLAGFHEDILKMKISPAGISLEPAARMSFASRAGFAGRIETLMLQVDSVLHDLVEGGDGLCVCLEFPLGNDQV